MNLSFCKFCVLIPVFFFNDTATTEIYTLSLHDALPILLRGVRADAHRVAQGVTAAGDHARGVLVGPEDRRDALATDRVDRKSTRLNSSHANISYAVFCLKKKNTNLPSN